MSVQHDVAKIVVKKELPRVGIIGLGMIGGGVAVSLERSGRKATVYDVNPVAAQNLPVDLPMAESAAAVARNSDVVILAVVNAEQVRAALRGDDGVLAGANPGSILLVLSTLAVPEVLELARECAESGVTVLDCGVTPGDRASENGMVAMVGGDDHSVRRAMPVLVDFARKVVHCGPLGAGMATKIARNVVTYGTWRVMHEAAGIAQAGGVAPTTLLAVIDEADPGGATMSSLLRGRMNDSALMDEHATQIHTLMDKDLAAAQDLAHGAGLDVPVVDATRAEGAETLHLQQPSAMAVGNQPSNSIGLETMATVYGSDLVDRMPEDRSPTLDATIEHLFGEVWSRPGLSIRDRRLLVLGATAALGRADLIEVQVRGALLNKELTAEQLDELVLQLHYYVGWGNGTRVQEGVTAALRSVQNTT